MNDLMNNGLVEEVYNTQNLSYILKDNAGFFLTEYKVLRTKENIGLIKCAKVLLNGKVKLMYFTEEKKSLKSILQSVDADDFMVILANLMSTIIDIKNNGFLHCKNLFIAEERIFVDAKTLNTGLIYLPLNGIDLEQTTFENEFRTWVIKLVASCNILTNTKIDRLCAVLVNDELTFEELYQYVCNAVKEEMGNIRQEENIVVEKISNVEQTPRMSVQKPMKLAAMNVETQFAFNIAKSEFIIGKNPSLVDGLISFNNAISRVHCKFVWKDDAYYLVDLGSANGTFLNGNRLLDKQPYQVKQGDVVRVANMEFMVQI